MRSSPAPPAPTSATCSSPPLAAGRGRSEAEFVLFLQAVSCEVGYVSELFVSYQGEGARVGEKQLFVRFAGCNFRCRYCDTPASLVRVPTCEISFPDGEVVAVPNPLSIADLAMIVERFFSEDPAIARVSLTGGEPMVQQRFIASWLRAAPPPVGCMLETTATVSGGLDDVLPHIAMVSADIKLPSNSGERPLWDHHRQFLAKCRSRGRLSSRCRSSGDTDRTRCARGARLAHETIPRRHAVPPADHGPATTALGRRAQSRLLALLAAASTETSARDVASADAQASRHSLRNSDSRQHGPLRQSDRDLAPPRRGGVRLLVIGGGINGAAVARDAVLRGMSVALLERGDFACGHQQPLVQAHSRRHPLPRAGRSGAGARVLPRARPACARARAAPGACASVSCSRSTKTTMSRRWQLRIGLLLYDLLAGFQNVRNHQHLSAADAARARAGAGDRRASRRRALLRLLDRRRAA